MTAALTPQRSPSPVADAIAENVPRLSGDIARRAFDAAAGIARVTTLAELDEAMRPSLSTLGFLNFVAVDVRGPDIRLIVGKSHPLWYPHLVANGYHMDDAPFVAARAGASAVFYGDVARAQPLTPLQARIADERRSFGLPEGFANTTYSPDGSAMTVAMTGLDIEIDNPDVRAAAHILSTYYGMAARRLEVSTATALAAPAVTLTQRQRDCLGWVREGKSATDIGAILGISAYTVHEHVAQACARLGVRTRVQAVATAIALRLIDP